MFAEERGARMHRIEGFALRARDMHALLRKMRSPPCSIMALFGHRFRLLRSIGLMIENSTSIESVTFAVRSSGLSRFAAYSVEAHSTEAGFVNGFVDLARPLTRSLKQVLPSLSNIGQFQQYSSR